MDKYTLGEEAYKNGYEKGFQDGIKHEKQVRENNNYAYQATMSKEDINKIPVMKKETIERGKRLLCNLYEDATLTDTNSKEYIEIQAYKEFADRLKEEIDRLKFDVKTKSQSDRSQAQVGQTLGHVHALCIFEEKINSIFNELTERKED